MTALPSPPPTEPIPTGWRARVQPMRGWRRLRESTLPIIQIVVAATAAYAVAHYALGHEIPLLAATVTVSSLGLVRDARPRRVLETVIGMLVGIIIAEALLWVGGTGWWQLALALGLTLAVARFLSAQSSFAIAAAIQSLIVMIMPASAPFLRVIDGSVGAIAALLATALIPRSPLRSVTRDAHALFQDFSIAGATVAQALHRGDRLRAERGLDRARGLQSRVDAWRGAIESGSAIARISPFLRRQRHELAGQDRIAQNMDLATRNLRVIARRVVYLCDDGTARPTGADVLGELISAAALIDQSLDDIAIEPVARESLGAVARRLDPAVIAAGESLGAQNLFAAMRPLAVDLLTAAGVPAAQARASIPRI